MCDCNNSDQLALLMEYTSSHMMMFTGLIAVAASAYYFLRSNFFNKENRLPTALLIIAAFCFVSAGIAIGMIASYIPHFNNFEQFQTGDSGTVEMLIKYKTLEKVENYGFWASISSFIAAIVCSKKPGKKEPKKKYF